MVYIGLGVSRVQALGSKAILFFGGPFLSLQYNGPLNGKFRRCGYGLNPKVSSRPKDPQSEVVQIKMGVSVN